MVEKADPKVSGPDVTADSDVPGTRRAARLHHVEIWVRDLAAARATLGWLFEELGYVAGEPWACGVSYRGTHEYIVLEAGPDVLAEDHRRRAPGVNHLAFVAGNAKRVDELTALALDRGFKLLFAKDHPFAGGPDHYAAYLEDATGFEIELVADSFDSAADLIPGAEPTAEDCPAT